MSKKDSISVQNEERDSELLQAIIFLLAWHEHLDVGDARTVFGVGI